VVKLRDIYPGHEILQVSAEPFESKCKESGLDRACRQTQTLAIPVGIEISPSEFQVEHFEAGQRGNASDHHLG
jgi:hypothetical protein